ncbi:hypothetical protein BEP19_00840 [Ammoniphilus oxalaticus]|uniref:Prepilin-type N-terminal cleavage/methylation domain-containing protein n=1 Tax=Ammoniphilus oxalaticus TaxID=66863 RepID=A0A419SMK4_9BACL|nr:prepilin-type N-terminal cleavage/methylation domain-containing protein [Ammoniphilus oxalaticus]RKD25524.1 hypothetical protein BEP19_00840 [Ammoniphilus oxalaticus]
MVKWQDQRGFSFLELSIVVAIMATLLLIGIPNYKKVMGKAQEISCDANLKLIETQMEHYYFEHREYPTIGDAFFKETDYFREIPKCPNQGVYKAEGSDPIKVTCTNHG